MSGAQAVALDVDGTLVTLRASVGELYSEALQGCGISLSPAVLNVALARAWQSFETEYLNSQANYATSVPREVILWHEFVRRTLESCEAGLGERRELLAAVYSFFARGASRRVVPGALETCRALAAAGIKVIAATNNDIRTKQVLDELGLSSSLTCVVTAGEIGWKKPSPKFFEAIARMVAVPLDEMLHVGNSRRLDVDAARQAGMRGLLYDPEGAGGVDALSDLRALAAECIR